MHSQFLILAILSLRALADITLTAYDHNDVHCNGKAIGNQVHLSGSECVIYQPEQPNANIHVSYWTRPLERIYNVTIFSDPNCQDNIGTIWPNINEHITHEDNVNIDSTCSSMGAIAEGPWGIAMRSKYHE